MLDLTREIFEAGKPVAFICHAGWVPISAGIVRGRRGTSVGAGAYFTIFIPFFPCPCGLVINPGADGSAASRK